MAPYTDKVFNPSELARVDEALKRAVETLRERDLFVEAEAANIRKRLTQLCLENLNEDIDGPALAELAVETYLVSG